MGKVKDFFKGLLGEQKTIVKKYFLTFALVIAITLVMVFAGFEAENIKHFYTAMIFTAIAVFFFESWTNLNWKRIIWYIISFLVAILLKEILMKNNINHFPGLFIIGFYIIVLILAFYKIVKNSKLSVSEYLTKIFQNNIIFGIAYSVIQIGIMFVTMIITTLLLKDTNYDLFLKVEIFIIGIIGIIGEMLCILNTKFKIIKPIDILINYIILPIVLIAELVIYLYFIKILVTLEIPSNQIFPIIAGLFIFAFPTWVMVNYFKDENKFAKYSAKILPYSFIPLICMQIYSISVRIFESGLTHTRYIGIALLIFEIFAVILTIVKKQKYLDKILLVAALITVVAACVPEINIVDASWKSQLHRLTSMFKENTNFDELNKETQSKVLGAYYFLYSDEEGKNHIPEYTNVLNQYEFQSESENKNDIYIHVDNVDSINVQGFSRIRKANEYLYYYNYDEFNSDYIRFNNFLLFEDENLDDKINNKIIETVEEMIEKGELENNLLYINDDLSIYLEKYELNYSSKSNTITYLNIAGYLLMK